MTKGHCACARDNGHTVAWIQIDAGELKVVYIDGSYLNTLKGKAN